MATEINTIPIKILELAKKKTIAEYYGKYTIYLFQHVYLQTV